MQCIPEMDGKENINGKSNGTKMDAKNNSKLSPERITLRILPSVIHPALELVQVAQSVIFYLLWKARGKVAVGGSAGLGVDCKSFVWCSNPG